MLTIIARKHIYVDTKTSSNTARLNGAQEIWADTTLSRCVIWDEKWEEGLSGYYLIPAPSHRPLIYCCGT